MAENLVAIVESFNGDRGTIEPMELLEKGREITLKDGEVLILGYFQSCIRETTRGGHVAVGDEQSRVTGSKPKIEEVDCDGGVMVSPSASKKEAAVAIFRKGAVSKNFPKPDWTVFGTQPLFRVPKDVTSIEIRRLDDKAPPIVLQAKGQLIDSSLAGVKLDPSGLYEISVGEQSIILKVSPLAEPGASLLSRLVTISSENLP